MSLVHIANHLFTKGSRIRFMTLMQDYGPFMDILASHVNDEVVNLVIVPKICLQALGQIVID